MRIMICRLLIVFSIFAGLSDEILAQKIILTNKSTAAVRPRLVSTIEAIDNTLTGLYILKREIRSHNNANSYANIGTSSILAASGTMAIVVATGGAAAPGLVIASSVCGIFGGASSFAKSFVSKRINNSFLKRLDELSNKATKERLVLGFEILKASKKVSLWDRFTGGVELALNANGAKDLKEGLVGLSCYVLRPEEREKMLKIFLDSLKLQKPKGPDAVFELEDPNTIEALGTSELEVFASGLEHVDSADIFTSIVEAASAEVLAPLFLAWNVGTGINSIAQLIKESNISGAEEEVLKQIELLEQERINISFLADQIDLGKDFSSASLHVHLVRFKNRLSNQYIRYNSESNGIEMSDDNSGDDTLFRLSKIESDKDFLSISPFHTSLAFDINIDNEYEISLSGINEEKENQRMVINTCESFASPKGVTIGSADDQNMVWAQNEGKIKVQDIRDNYRDASKEWQIEPLESSGIIGLGPYVRLKNMQSGKYLSMENGNAVKKVKIVQHDDNHSRDMVFRLVRVFDYHKRVYFYHLVPLNNSALAVDITSNRFKPSTRLQLWTRNQSQAQMLEICPIGKDLGDENCVKYIDGFVSPSANPNLRLAPRSQKDGEYITLQNASDEESVQNQVWRIEQWHKPM